MKKKVALLLAMGISVASSATIAAVSLNNDTDKLSYTIGVDLGKNLKKQDITINPAVMTKGLEDGLANAQFIMTEPQMKDVLVAFQKKLLEKQADAFNKKAQENKTKGEDFLSQNKSKPGVVTLRDRKSTRLNSSHSQ